MTIFEKIKSLSMESMATFLCYEYFGCGQCDGYSEVIEDGECDRQCKAHCMDWLAKEAAE